nr:uncharacterized protein LOC129420640 [Misgurnus anguillicaudatus]
MHKPTKNPADWMYRRCARRGRSYSVVLEPGPTWYDPLLFGPGVNSRREPARTAGPIPLSTIPEGLTVGVLALEDPAITTPVPASSVQPPDLRGKRERRVSWESPSEGSSSEPAAPTTVLTSPATASAPRPRKKKRRKGVSLSPRSPLSAPLSAPVTPWNPAVPPFVPPVIPAISQPLFTPSGVVPPCPSPTKPAVSKNSTKSTRTPRPKPSTSPLEPKTPCPPSSTLPGLPHCSPGERLVAAP